MQGIVKYMRSDIKGRWVAQKYMERPLSIYKKKFDIRQWVLVSFVDCFSECNSSRFSGVAIRQQVPCLVLR